MSHGIRSGDFFVYTWGDARKYLGAIFYRVVYSGDKMTKLIEVHKEQVAEGLSVPVKWPSGPDPIMRKPRLVDQVPAFQIGDGRIAYRWDGEPVLVGPMPPAGWDSVRRAYAAEVGERELAAARLDRFLADYDRWERDRSEGSQEASDAAAFELLRLAAGWLREIRPGAATADR